MTRSAAGSSQSGRSWFGAGFSLSLIVLGLWIPLHGFAQPRQDAPAPASWEFQKANDCLQKQDCTCAIPALERAIELYSSYVDALVALGYCYFQKGRYDDAIQRANAALALSKRESLAFLTLAMTYEQQGELDLAVQNYLSAIRFKRNDAVAHFGLARVYERQSRTAEAIAEYQAALDANPQNLAALNALGQIYFHARRYREAEAALRDILKVSPDNPAALMRLGSLYIETKQFDRAVESLQAVLKIDYNQPIIHFRLGETYLAAGRPEPAMTHYSIAAELDPSFLEAKMKLAAIRVSQKQVGQALELYDSVIASGQSEFLETACREKVRLLSEAGQRSRAAEAAELALNVFPDDPTFLELAARRRLEAGQTGIALELATRLTSLEPKSARAWSLRGSIELAAGNGAAAAASLSTAIEADPQSAQALATLGTVEALAGQTDQARRHLEQALALQPTMVSALNHLAVLKLEEDVAGSTDLLAKAAKLNPDSPVLSNNLSVALARSGRLQEARAALQKLVDAQPLEADWRWNLAVVLMALGDARGAMAHVQPLAESGSREPAVWRLLGDIHVAQTQLDQAEAAYRRALDLAGESPGLRAVLLYDLGTLALARPQRRARAQGLLAEAARLDPALPEAQNNLGCLSYQAGRMDEARQYFRNAVKLQPANKTFLMNLIAAGEVLTPEQIAQAEQLTAEDRSAAESQVADSLISKGFVALGARRYAEAVSAFTKAREAGVRSAALENATAVALVRLKRFDEAREHLQTALQIVPNAPEALLNSALLYDLALGDTPQALRYYERYLELGADPKIARYVERIKRFSQAPGD
jgi:tetratricopeptide (TPR) repeat protein